MLSQSADAALQAPPRVFISYARSDGDAAAADLVNRLTREHPEIRLWQDRVSMEGGVGWWKQIAEALEQVAIMVMIVTPAALSSEVARKEWRYARQLGVRVCPVFGVPADQLEADQLPPWLRRIHCQDLEREWNTFVSLLYTAKKESRVPFMAPDLRDDFVERLQELDLVASALLGGDRSGPASLAALQGPGGFGKTTLAIALCHREEIVEEFHDGILWATLGQKPNVKAELTKIYAALTGQRPAFVDVDDVAMHLMDALYEKRCLIIIDDVWDPNHVKPFLRGGDHCSRLVTTRVPEVAIELDARRVMINEMTGQQSVALLSAHLSSRGDEAPALVRSLARRLGYWPLLLKLAASQLRQRTVRGSSLADAVQHVNTALDHRGLEAFDRSNREDRHDAIASTVWASLGALSESDQQHCTELATLPPSIPLPLSAVSALWQLSAFETEELVQRLDGVALVDYDMRTATIRLHDVLRSYLFEQLDAPASVHAALVERGWPDHHRLPDRHAWRWIGWHLVCAGQTEALERLLLDYDWLKAKLAATDAAALLDDFERVAASPTLRPVRDAVRLALHGLSSDAGQLSAQLLGRLESGRCAALDGLLERAAKTTQRPWLRLCDRSLTSPGGALLAILKADSGPVSAVALRPPHIISASEDGRLRIWDLGTNSVVRWIDGQSGPIHCLAVTPDGRQIVAGSEDRGLAIWDAETGALLRQLRGHSGAVQGVSISPRGDRIVSVSDAGQVCVAETTGIQRHLFKVSAHQLRPVAFTPDGVAVAFGAGDGTAMLVDVENGAHLRTFRGHDRNVRALAFTADGRMVTGSEDGTLRLWDVSTGQTQQTFVGHAGGVEAVAITPDGTRVLSASKDQTLRLWDATTGAMLKSLEGHSGSIRAVAITESGTNAVSASADRTLRYWQLDSETLAPTPRAHLGPLSLLATSADGKLAVSSSMRSPVIRVWDADTAREMLDIHAVDSTDRAIPRRHREPISYFQNDLTWLRLTPDGTRVLAGYSNRVLRTWDVASGKLLRETLGIFNGHWLALSRDARYAASQQPDRSVRFLDLQSGRLLRLLVAPDHERASLSLGTPTPLPDTPDLPEVVDIAPELGRGGRMALSDENRWLVLGFDTRVVCWQLETGRVLLEDLGDFDVRAVAIDRHERLAVVGSRFGALRVIDLERGATLRTLEGHQGTILDLAFLDDARLVSAGKDDTLRVWDLESGREVHRHDVRAGGVEEVVISRDGRFAFSIYGDTVVLSQLTPPRRLGSLSLDHGISAISVTADGLRVVLGDESGRLHFAKVEQ